jgi:hypothetical protein
MRIYRNVDKVEQLSSRMERILTSYPTYIVKISPNFFHVVFGFDSNIKKL